MFAKQCLRLLLLARPFISRKDALFFAWSVPSNVVLNAAGCFAPLLLAQLIHAANGQAQNSVWPLFFYAVCLCLPIVFGLYIGLGNLKRILGYTESLRLKGLMRALDHRAASVAPGERLQTIEGDIGRFEFLFNTLGAQLPFQFVTLSTILLLVAYKSPTTGLYLLLYSTVVFFLLLGSGKFIASFAEEAQRQREQVFGLLEKYLSHVSLIWSTASDGAALEHLGKAERIARWTSLRAGLVAQLIASGPQLAAASFTVALLLAASASSDSPGKVAMLLAVVIYLEQLISPIGITGNALSQLRLAIPGLNRAATLVDHQEVETEVPSQPMEELKVNLTIGAETRQLAVAGLLVIHTPNGSGKTTALQSLTGLGTANNARLTHNEVLLSPAERREVTLYIDDRAIELWARLLASPQEHALDNLLQASLEKWQPRLICFDEALDRLAIESAYGYVEKLVRSGHLVIVTTHSRGLLEALNPLGESIT